jgi:hypothetical protein
VTHGSRNRTVKKLDNGRYCFVTAENLGATGFASALEEQEILSSHWRSQMGYPNQKSSCNKALEQVHGGVIVPPTAHAACLIDDEHGKGIENNGN